MCVGRSGRSRGGRVVGRRGAVIGGGASGDELGSCGEPAESDGRRSSGVVGGAPDGETCCLRGFGAGDIGDAEAVAVVEVGGFEGCCNARSGRTVCEERVEEDGGVERSRQDVVLEENDQYDPFDSVQVTYSIS